ncbi:MAG: VPDSG-CTERM sorting domain-containing protein [Opitutus sp.]
MPSTPVTDELEGIDGFEGLSSSDLALVDQSATTPITAAATAPTAVPDTGVTLLLFSGAMVGLFAVRRRAV